MQYTKYGKKSKSINEYNEFTIHFQINNLFLNQLGNDLLQAKFIN